MRDVGLARKKKGAYGRVSMRQLPEYDTDSSPHEEINDQAVSSKRTVAAARSCPKQTMSRLTLRRRDSSSPDPSDSSATTDADETMPRSQAVVSRAKPPTTTFDLLSSNLATYPAYQLVRSKFGVDLTDLVVLTNFNVGKATTAILSADPSRLISLLGQQQWSYLQFVPARYGHSECLTAATNVLLARAQHALSPSEPCTSLCTRLYGKALRSLQDALTNDALAMDADVLAATQLLSLHEVSRRPLSNLRAFDSRMTVARPVP